MSVEVQRVWVLGMSAAPSVFGSRSGRHARVFEPDPLYGTDRPRPMAWSRSARRLSERLVRPELDRPIADYDAGFVERYIPNVSSLLPPSLADQLHDGCRWVDTLPRGAFARAVEEPMVLDLSWSSSRLEGVSLSRRQAQGLFSLGSLIQDPRSAHDEEVRMLLNHKRAIEYMVQAAPNQRFGLELVLAIHDLLMEGLMPDPLDQGRVREHEVDINGARFEPEQDSARLRDLLVLILEKAQAIRHPVEAAFFLWVQIPYLQAFGDGNKRTSRLMANVPLLLRNCAPITFEGIDEHDYRLAMLGVYEHQDPAIAIDLFEHTYRKSIRKYMAVLASRPRLDARAAQLSPVLRRVVRDVVVGRRSAAASVAFADLPPEDAKELGEMLALRLRTLASRHSDRFDIDEAAIDSWIAAGRPQ